MGRSSRSQADANRARIVQIASGLFRAHGVAAIGIADVMKAAGMTQGGFYRHFSSKDALAAEACTLAFSDAAERWRNVAQRAASRGKDIVGALVAYYLKPKPPEQTCPMIALASDAAHATPDNPLYQAYGEGVQHLFDAFVEAAAQDRGDAERTRLAERFSSMVGANMLLRATPAAAGLVKQVMPVTTVH